MADGSGRFGSQAIQAYIFQKAMDPVQGILGTPVGDRVHKYPVPEDFVFPYLTFLRRGAIDVGPVGRGMPVTASTLTYEVKGVDEGWSTERIEEAAGLMDAAMDGDSTTFFLEGHWYDISVTRTSELQVELVNEDEGGQVFQHLGGIYDFYVCRVS